MDEPVFVPLYIIRGQEPSTGKPSLGFATSIEVAREVADLLINGTIAGPYQCIPATDEELTVRISFGSPES
jgi:hypothetical protein